MGLASLSKCSTPTEPCTPPAAAHPLGHHWLSTAAGAAEAAATACGPAAAAASDAASAPSPSPSTPHHDGPNQQCSLKCKLVLFTLCCHAAGSYRSRLGDALPNAIWLGLSLALLLLVSLRPRAYLRWCPALLAAHRLSIFASPLLGGGTGFWRVLQSDPLQGPAGAAVDLFKLLWGSRLLMAALSCATTSPPEMPVVPHLLVQALSLALALRSGGGGGGGGSGGLCAAPLLAHPLSVARISSLHSVMQMMSFVLPGGAGQSVAWLLQGESREQQCEAFLSFLFLTVGLMLPIVFLLKTEPLQSLRSWEAKRREACRKPAAGGLQGMAHAVEAGLRQLCGRSWLAERCPQEAEEEEELTPCSSLFAWPCPPGLQAPLSAWLLLSVGWVLSVAAAS